MTYYMRDGLPQPPTSRSKPPVAPREEPPPSSPFIKVRPPADPANPFGPVPRLPSVRPTIPPTLPAPAIPIGPSLDPPVAPPQAPPPYPVDPSIFPGQARNEPGGLPGLMLAIIRQQQARSAAANSASAGNSAPDQSNYGTAPSGLFGRLLAQARDALESNQQANSYAELGELTQPQAPIDPKAVRMLVRR
jgi:hypothetical protein